MSVLINGLRILSIPQEWQKVVIGAIVIVAVYADMVRRRRRRLKAAVNKDPKRRSTHHGVMRTEVLVRE